jgi:hypothetical protein
MEAWSSMFSQVIRDNATGTHHLGSACPPRLQAQAPGLERGEPTCQYSTLAAVSMSKSIHLCSGTVEHTCFSDNSLASTASVNRDDAACVNLLLRTSWIQEMLGSGWSAKKLSRYVPCTSSCANIVRSSPYSSSLVNKQIAERVVQHTVFNIPAIQLSGKLVLKALDVGLNASCIRVLLGRINILLVA